MAFTSLLCSYKLIFVFNHFTNIMSDVQRLANDVNKMASNGVIKYPYPSYFYGGGTILPHGLKQVPAPTQNSSNPEGDKRVQQEMVPSVRGA